MEERHKPAIMIQIWRVVVVGIVTHVHIFSAVRIYPEQQRITTNTSSPMVTLPCLYNTTSLYSPRIAWYRLSENEREKVVSIGTGNDIIEHRAPSGRIIRSSGASLVLIGPSTGDVGLYMCEIDVLQDIPPSATGLVYLDVHNTTFYKPNANLSTNVAQATGSEPSGCQTDTPNLWLMIIFDWIIPMCCVYAFPEGYRKIRIRMNTLGNLMIGLLVFGIVIATVLLTVSIRLLSQCYSVGDSNSDTRWKVGLPTGIIADMLIGAIVLFMLRMKVSSPQGNGAVVTSPDDIDDPLSEEVEPLDSPLTEIVSVPQTQILDLAEAPDAIHCLVVTGDNDNTVYMSTDHSVYSYNAERGDFQEIRIPNLPNVFMVSFHEDELYISTIANRRRSSFRGKLGSSMRKKNLVYVYDPENETKRVNRLDAFTTVPWLFKTSNGDIGITEKEKGQLRIFKGQSMSDDKAIVGKGFLQAPCCVVQNSRADFIIADIQKHEVYVFQEDGQFQTSFRVENFDALEDKMDSPIQVAVDVEDRVFVACKESCTILVFSSTFQFLEEISCSNDESCPVSAITINPKEESLYVACGQAIKRIPLASIKL